MSGPGISSAHAWRRALELTAPIGKNPHVTLPVVIERLAQAFGEAPALIADDQTFSYRTLAERTKRYSRWAVDNGVRTGDVVCLIMQNCPEYLAIWLGITRVGGIVALINTNLAGQSLARSIGVVQPKHVIASAESGEAFVAIRPSLDGSIRCWAHGGDVSGLPRIDHAVEAVSREDAGYAPPSVEETALYIYTSGTTGLPKAVVISHHRAMQWAHWFAGMTGAGPDDRLYNCLPMYHSIGGIVAPLAPLIAGGSVFIRKRFSVTQFWDDIGDRNCTVFQYIGELCRYLVNSPPHSREINHRLRLCVGNGLRSDIWAAFQQRFRIPQIIEFYAATEGGLSLYNCEGKIGSIGRIPPLFAHRFPVALVKSDVDSGEPLRDANGCCLRCGGNEPGEAIVRISRDGTDPGSRFDGYTDAQASERKILRNVFNAGDAWYRTGDLMRRDAGGYFYFVDRIGDTFRWKGENVSTAEVAEAMSTCPGVLDVAVYGVIVPGSEGRAGMAALVTDERFAVATLQRHLEEQLPEYARPLFLRITSELPATGTFKPNKRVLAEAGYDPAAVTDDLYMYDRSLARFLILDAATHRRVISGSDRL